MSPYGETKLVGEWMVRACAQAFGLRAVALRYFNVAGAAAPELADTGVFNLVPMVFERVWAGRAPRVFGDDYATPDGTCVRDFVHVDDLARAHVVAARSLETDGDRFAVYNIGTGSGHSVREVIAAVGEVTGLAVEPEVLGRRAGDPPRVVAAVDRARDDLGFTASRGLRDMVGSAWAGWTLRHGPPQG